MISHPRCPICGKETVEGYKPFCSKRCADIDLNRWLTGGYAVSGSDDDSEGAGDGPSGDEPYPVVN